MRIRTSIRIFLSHYKYRQGLFLRVLRHLPADLSIMVTSFLIVPLRIDHSQLYYRPGNKQDIYSGQSEAGWRRRVLLLSSKKRCMLWSSLLERDITYYGSLWSQVLGGASLGRHLSIKKSVVLSGEIWRKDIVECQSMHSFQKNSHL